MSALFWDCCWAELHWWFLPSHERSDAGAAVEARACLCFGTERWSSARPQAAGGPCAGQRRAEFEELQG